MSLLQSAKLHGHDSWAYLKDVLTGLPTHMNSRIEELLPHRWTPSTYKLPSSQPVLAGCLPWKSINSTSSYRAPWHTRHCSELPKSMRLSPTSVDRAQGFDEVKARCEPGQFWRKCTNGCRQHLGIYRPSYPWRRQSAIACATGER